MRTLKRTLPAALAAAPPAAVLLPRSGTAVAPKVSMLTLRNTGSGTVTVTVTKA